MLIFFPAYRPNIPANARPLPVMTIAPISLSSCASSKAVVSSPIIPLFSALRASGRFKYIKATLFFLPVFSTFRKLYGSPGQKIVKDLLLINKL
jgi:hypothetical protein